MVVRLAERLIDIRGMYVMCVTEGSTVMIYSSSVCLFELSYIYISSSLLFKMILDMSKTITFVEILPYNMSIFGYHIQPLKYKRNIMIAC